MWTMSLAETLLFAATTTETEGALANPWIRAVLYLIGAALLFIIPSYIGSMVSRSARMPEMRWKVSVILFSLFAGILVVGFGWPPRYGVDLNGGVILVYQVEIDATSIGEVDEEGQFTAGDRGTPVTNDLIEALKRRLNPDGLKEIMIRPFGASQVEIVVPEVEGVAIAELKRNIATAGELRFRIVANSKDHSAQISAAQAQANDPAARTSRDVRDRSGKIIARWVRVGRDPEQGGIAPLKVDVSFDFIRDARTGQFITNIPQSAMNTDTNRTAFERWLQQEGHEAIEVLMVEPEPNSALDVHGDQLGVIRADFDENLAPSVSFSMRAEGARRMAVLTNSNLPDKDTDFHRRLGIVLDNELLSAPRIMSVISDRGRITGRFTQEEVNFLVRVLRAGKLPAVLNKEPISENIIGPILGAQTIKQGGWSIFVSMILVLIFAAAYYRVAGLIACFALAMNLTLTLGLMILFSAPLTLPGLAGLVLTVGMSVDANVLIFERIREELSKGATLRMAIRNGFSRATSAIVDSNLTTFITAVVLYVIGTDQIRGFAVTLALGILMCMYTAVFCSRVVFEISERKRWITSLRMSNLIGATNIDFLKYRNPAAMVSAAVILIGLLAVFARGAGLFDIDFRGGTSVVMNLAEPMDDAEVRRALDEKFDDLRIDGSRVQYTLNRMDVSERQRGTVWKIDSSIARVSELQEILQETFPLVTYSMDINRVGPAAVPPPTTPGIEPPTPPAGTPARPGAELSGEGTPPAVPTPDEPEAPESEAPEPDPAQPATPESESAEPESPQPETTPEEVPATEEPEAAASEETTAEDAVTEEPAAEGPATEETSEEAVDNREADDAVDSVEEGEEAGCSVPDDFISCQDESQELAEETPAESAAETQPPAEPESPGDPISAPETSDTPSVELLDSAESQSTQVEVTSELETRPAMASAEAEIEFRDLVDETTLRQLITEAAEQQGMGFVSVALVPATLDESGRNASLIWYVTLGTDPEQARRLLAQVEDRIDRMPVWESASEIGSKVADDTKEKAVAAIVISFLGIVAYIWLRFQKVAFGLAAVAALAHDVLVTLGAIGISYWLAAPLSFLLIDEFKINLTVIAAFLTIIGYSLNDTIVIFDRVRELRGKSPELTNEMINLSLNQTLSRTILTTFTTLIVVGILYVFGGSGIHDFAFSLLIGMLAGVYSTMFIACPVLLWIVNRVPATAKTTGSP